MQNIFDVLEQLHNKLDELIEKYQFEAEDIEALDEIFAQLDEEEEPVEEEEAVEED